jgi:hypothetical protein
MIAYVELRARPKWFLQDGASPQCSVRQWADDFSQIDLPLEEDSETDIKVSGPEPHGFLCLGIFEIMRLRSADDSGRVV